LSRFDEGRVRGGQGVARRLEAVDQFRGFAILAMVLANYLQGVACVPPWLKHAPDVGLTGVDLIAPFFIFAIGLTYGLSARGRLLRADRRSVVEHFLSRYFAIAGIGLFFTAVEIRLGLGQPGILWGVLQAIGAAGLITLPFIFLPASARWVAGFGLLALYQILLDRWWLDSVRASSHGGMQGSLSWGAMLILATAMADLYHDPRRDRMAFPLASALMLASGAALALAVPLSKMRVSASYVLVCLGASGAVFELFRFLCDTLGLRSEVLSAWGRNPLLLYVLHVLLLGVFVLPRIPSWYAEAPAWLVPLEALALLGALSWIGLALNRRGWYFKL
jgi:predicted acyltransferase